MTMLLAAVGATLAALFETTATPYLSIGGSHPHVVFVLGVIVTVVLGFDRGIVWAFTGGILLDVLTQRPLGSTAFALLLAVGGTVVIGRILFGVRPVLPVVATFVLSAVYSMSLFVTYGALRGPIRADDPVALVAPGIVFDTLLAAILGPLAIALVDRRTEPERAAW